MVKVRLWNKEDETRNTALAVLTEVLNIILKLLHPFMPFITEEIYCTVNEDVKSIMIELGLKKILNTILRMMRIKPSL